MSPGFGYQVMEEDRIRILFCERTIKRGKSYPGKSYPVVPFPPAAINDFPWNYCILKRKNKTRLQKVVLFFLEKFFEGAQTLPFIVHPRIGPLGNHQVRKTGIDLLKPFDVVFGE
jgi:hypothetical protein